MNSKVREPDGQFERNNVRYAKRLEETPFELEETKQKSIESSLKNISKTNFTHHGKFETTNTKLQS